MATGKMEYLGHIHGMETESPVIPYDPDLRKQLVNAVNQRA